MLIWKCAILASADAQISFQLVPSGTEDQYNLDDGKVGQITMATMADNQKSRLVVG